ncbi:PQQ-binding-like beta-propeller repeat protein [Streptomyces sp. CB01881]|uniref:outer membrane protein assembly factor BamB family protein n=1 Tax=Streptomyces sp. CB01881 TaxID=2078691 RepID=UPI00129CDD3A|nr:PQQ-binding-like beta-propeller repeat protein [Streptomyces sp. CB01881]
MAAFDAGPQEPVAQAELTRVLVEVMAGEPPFAVQLTALIPPTVPLPPSIPPQPPQPPRIGRDGIIIDGKSRVTGNLALGDQVIQNVRQGDLKTVLALVAALALVVAAGYGGVRIFADGSPGASGGGTVSESVGAGAVGGGSPGVAPGGAPSSSAAGAAPSPSRSGPEPVRADPPVRFRRSPLGPGGGKGTVVLDGPNLVYVADGRTLQSVDGHDGRVLARMTSAGRIPAPSQDDQKVEGVLPGRPGVGTAGGRHFAVAAFPLVIPGQGTVSDHYAVEVDVLDLGTGEEAGRVRLDDGTISAGAPAVVGIAGGRAVVTVPALSGLPSTYAVDLASGAVAWKLANFQPRLVQDATLVGVSALNGYWDPGFMGSPNEVRAVGAADGTVLWKAMTEAEGIGLTEFAADKVLAYEGHPDGHGTHTLLSTSTGQSIPMQLLDAKGATINSCRFDGRATTVCEVGDYQGGRLIAVDSAGGNVLWQLGFQVRAGERAAPSVTGAWHGAVYGLTQKREPVVLDARTGQDRETAPGATPYLVDEYVALAGDGLYLSAG